MNSDHKVFIRTPNYPDPYPDSSACSWNFTNPCPRNRGFFVTFDLVDLGPDSKLDIIQDGQVRREIRGSKIASTYLPRSGLEKDLIFKFVGGLNNEDHSGFQFQVGYPRMKT